MAKGSGVIRLSETRNMKFDTNVQVEIEYGHPYDVRELGDWVLDELREEGSKSSPETAGYIVVRLSGEDELGNETHTFTGVTKSISAYKRGNATKIREIENKCGRFTAYIAKESDISANGKLVPVGTLSNDTHRKSVAGHENLKAFMNNKTIVGWKNVSVTSQGVPSRINTNVYTLNSY